MRPQDATIPSAKRRKVEHYFWIRDMEFAHKFGVEMRSLCGVWSSATTEEPDFVCVIGGFMPLPESEDCKRCMRVHEKALREGTAR